MAANNLMVWANKVKHGQSVALHFWRLQTDMPSIDNLEKVKKSLYQISNS